LWRPIAAVALVLAAPFAYLQSAANADMPAPQWARAWNGFRLADDARARLSGNPQNPQAGLTIGPGAEDLARAAYAREPLAGNALFVLALAQAPLRDGGSSGPVAREAVRLDKRNALLQLIAIADAAGRGDDRALFAHADLLAAAHPDLADAALAPLFARLDDPALVPMLAEALTDDPRWAPALKRYVPANEAALRNYAALRRQAGAGQSWNSDEQLVAAFADKGLYAEAFDVWRGLQRGQGDPFGFTSGARFAPIGWRLAERGDRSARVTEDGAMAVTVERGAGGELARRLLQLSPGRYRLAVRIDASEPDPPLTVTLQCAVGGADAFRLPLATQTEFRVSDASCPAYWLMLGGSALDSRHGIDATLSGWRLTRV
jgi:hypothetical protein